MHLNILSARDATWAAAVAHPDQLFSDPDFRLLKRTRRTVAGFLAIDGNDVFIKCVEEGGILKGWMRRVWGSRARRVLRGAALLQAAGFARPEPLAAAETRAYGAVRASCVVSEALDGARVMSQAVFEGGRRRFRHRCAVLAAVAREVRRLHDAGIYTHDLQETNLMLTGSGDDWKIHFVDLEDFRRARRVSPRRRMLNLVHLDRTIGRFLPRTQRLRFFYRYLGGAPQRDEARRLLRQYFALRERAQQRADRQRPAVAPAPPTVSTGPAAAPGLQRAGAARD